MTQRHEHIACFVDDSDAARRGLGEAVRLRDQLGAGRSSVVNLIPPPVYYGVPFPPQDAATPADWLEELVAATSGGTMVLIDKVDRYPPAVAVAWAEQERADLLVAASHRGVFRRMILGSFAAHLAYHATCPVVLVPPPTPPEPSAEGA